MDHHLSEAQWVAIAAHRLQYRWRSIDPGQLDELAAELWRDPALRALEPTIAIDAWLSPVWEGQSAVLTRRSA